MTSESDKLEQLIGRTLREQPLRGAPASLESRIFAALEASARVGPWKKGFVHWPLAARAAFILASFGFVKLALLAAGWTAAAVNAPELANHAAAKVFWIEALASALLACMQSIPAAWVWGGFLSVAALYGTVFALSAVAYRTLYAAR